MNRGPRWLAALVGAVVGSVLLCSLWAGVASAARVAGVPGAIEICKAPDNGAAGQSFSFTASLGTAVQRVTVTGGTCSTPINAAPGSWTIVEDLSSGLWNMVGASVQPSTAWLAESDKVGKVKVAVVSGQETQVTFTNAPALATVKVCKWSASPTLQGSQFSFTIGSQTVTAVAGTQSRPGCSMAVPTQPGTRLKITEAVPAGLQIAGATFNGAPVSSSNGLVRVTAGTGANIVTIDNEPIGPPQTGYVEICKDTGDQFVSTTDPFTFTITDKTGFTDTEQVLAGQCTGPVKVAAGNVNIAEAPTATTEVTDISAIPSTALGPRNLVNGTATVVVPVSSDTSGEVQVHYVNSTPLTTVKICKVLTSTSGALNGQKFYFSVTDALGTQNVTIVASSSPAGACKNLGISIPIGSMVSVTEAPTPWVGVEGNAPNTGATKVITAVAGINTISFLNQAYGQYEICKNIAPVAGDPSYDGTVFNFSADGSATSQPVAAGRCGQPKVVPVGTHTVKEVSIPYGFAFVSSMATGSSGDNRATSGTAANGGNPITFTVPYFNDPSSGGETLVTFVNRVLRVQIKLCKLIDPGSVTSIGGLSYNFNVYVGTMLQPISNTAATQVQPPYPGANSCTGLLLSTPVIDAHGNPITITVQEIVTGPYFVSAAMVDNVKPGTSVQFPGNQGANSITFTPGTGVDVVTLTNSYKQPA